jgi:DNA-binding PadR family transcriptional regulator
MYEFIILSLLMRAPMHGYLIAKIANDQIGPWAKISRGTLSTILGKLEEVGLIALATPDPAPPNRRQSRTFTITEAGRSRFYQMMHDTSSNLSDYQRLFYLKLVFFDLIRPEERLLLWSHYLIYCQTTALYLQTEAASLRNELAGESNTDFRDHALKVMTRMEQQWRAEVDWAIEERAREAATEAPETAAIDETIP